MPKTNALMVLILVVGAIIGSVVNELLVGHAPAFLTQTVSVGLSPPAHLDLLVFQLDVGFLLELSFCSIIGLVLAILIFRKL